MTFDCEEGIIGLSYPADISWERDYRKENQLKQKKKEEEEKEKAVRRVYVTSIGLNPPPQLNSICSPQVASSLFLAHNTALVPPYRVLIDTNFINFSLQNKLELISGMMDCLYAKCGFAGLHQLFHSNFFLNC